MAVNLKNGRMSYQKGISFYFIAKIGNLIIKGVGHFGLKLVLVILNMYFTCIPN